MNRVSVATEHDRQAGELTEPAVVAKDGIEVRQSFVDLAKQEADVALRFSAERVAREVDGDRELIVAAKRERVDRKVGRTWDPAPVE